MKTNLDKLFQDLEGSFDLNETPAGHRNRFLEKLNAAKKTEVKRLNWWKPLSIAASLAILVSLGTFYVNANQSANDLASVSPEMKQTQSFFTTTINQELEQLMSFNDPEAKDLVDDALVQIEILERKYEGLKEDLISSGNDKRVIYAMISNFQNRIDLLQQVIEKIEEIKNLKAYRNETTI